MNVRLGGDHLIECQTWWGSLEGEDLLIDDDTMMTTNTEMMMMMLMMMMMTTEKGEVEDGMMTT